MRPYPWDTLPKEFRWCAMDEDGAVYAFTKKPEMSDPGSGLGVWLPPGENYNLRALYGEFDHAQHWRTSLKRRPSG